MRDQIVTLSDGDKDEFEDGDTSDEEDRRNTIGNIPIEWYDHLGHIGYDLDGKKIARPIKSKDEIDDLLAKCEDPNYWKRITDRTTLRREANITHYSVGDVTPGDKLSLIHFGDDS